MTTDKHIDAPAHTPGRLHIRVWDRLSGEQNVSRQYDAKQSVLAAYPENTEAGVYLFLEILNIDESDFVYEEGITIAEYIYGPRPAPPTKQEG